jgi:DNA/RNA endonuclease YhcR with UshA esterase domain
MPNLDRDTYRNRVVRVSGKVTLFKEQPQIVVTDPAQIQIVER